MSASALSEAQLEFSGIQAQVAALEKRLGQPGLQQEEKLKLRSKREDLLVKGKKIKKQIAQIEEAIELAEEGNGFMQQERSLAARPAPITKEEVAQSSLRAKGKAIPNTSSHESGDSPSAPYLASSALSPESKSIATAFLNYNECAYVPLSVTQLLRATVDDGGGVQLPGGFALMRFEVVGLLQDVTGVDPVGPPKPVPQVAESKDAMEAKPEPAAVRKSPFISFMLCDVLTRDKIPARLYKASATAEELRDLRVGRSYGLRIRGMLKVTPTDRHIHAQTIEHIPNINWCLLFGYRVYKASLDRELLRQRKARNDATLV